MTQEEFDERCSEGDRLGWVYFLETASDSPVKIGWSKDPLKRLRLLQTAHHAELSLIGLLPGTRFLEKDLHRRLRQARISGEWFERRPTLKLVKPVIRDWGVFLDVRVDESRTIPEAARLGRYRKRTFYTVVQPVIPEN